MSPEDAIVIAPFANERMREWPLANYKRFIELALADDLSAIVVGTASQRARADRLVREFPASLVVNACGTMSWQGLVATLASSRYVVANNSGVAHLAADMQRWVLCVFGGAHSWIEWMPRGPRVVTVARMVSCAPCELGDQKCPNGLACLVHLEPDVAYKAISDAVAAGQRRLANPDPRRATALPTEAPA